MSNNAVIFDWNGTILDDAPYVLNATNYALKTIGVAPVSLETYQAEYTIPLGHSYKAFGCSDEQVADKEGKLTGAFFEHYEKHLSVMPCRYGTNAVLAYLKSRSIKTAVLSNYVVSKIEEQAKQFKIFDLLDDVLANTAKPETPFHKKGKGDWLKDYVARHIVEKGIVVGDTIEEIEIAHAFGFTSVAITGGTCSRERLEKAQPHFLIDELTPLIGIAEHVFA